MEKRVLIVEDEQVLAILMEMYIDNSGCSTAIGSVSSGEEAMLCVEAERPDIILMDVRIEGERDGIETAIDINKKYDIPIIYASANSDYKTAERAKKTNMIAFLTKPVSEEELKRIICSI